MSKVHGVMRCCLILLLGLVTGQAAPNVLLIIVDDLNTRLGCYGQKDVKSPNIDELARMGVRFERAYSHYPICNPSRTSLLSGRRPTTTKVFDNETPPRKYLTNVALLPEYFQQHGYFTARVGKIAHGGFEDQVKWDVALNPTRPPRIAGEQRWIVTNNKDEDEPDGSTAPRIVELLAKHKEKPFFIAAGFDKPHLPLIAPKRYFDLYPLESIDLPNEPGDVRKNVPWVAFTSTGGPWKNATEHRQVMAAYYACISFIDAQIGIIIDGLKRNGLMENTIICFTSDHGFHLGEHGGLWRKSTLFEESARVPLIMAVPGTTTAVCPRVTEHVDLFPTLVELCGLPQPPGLEGRSFVPLLKNPMAAWDNTAVTLFIRETILGDAVGQSLRTERWRYTEWNGGRRGTELYDHNSDPHEWTNLAVQAHYAGTVSELKQLLQKSGQPPKPAQPIALYVSLLGAAAVIAGVVVYRRRKA
ncbi:MAG TPA: sulfatase [Candidatus Binatia bacterium]|nr:sulfatase [Candidatus Binatia bacterium]